MTPAGVVAILVGAAILAALGIVTALGQRRRGARLPVVLLAGLFFPVAWIGWYLHDEMQEDESPSSP